MKRSSMKRWLFLTFAAVGLLVGVIVGPSKPLGAVSLVVGGACLSALLWSRGQRGEAAAPEGPTTPAQLWKAMDAGVDPTDDGLASTSTHDKLTADDARSVIPPSQETHDESKPT